MPAQRQARRTTIPRRCTPIDDNERIAQLFRDRRVSLLGGTSWLWANERFRDSVDVLFIDEAGQMSLADVLAVSAGAKSLVLLGDPQQLEQPQQASHPPGAAASALEHLLGGTKTIASRPRLVPASNTPPAPEDLRVHGRGVLREPADVGAGPRAASRAGAGRLGGGGARRARASSTCPSSTTPTNRARSEEVDAVVALVAALTADGVRYRNAAGEEAPLDDARTS